MSTRPPEFPATLQPTPPRIAELDRLGDQIAELSAHLEAATARLLALIREFDDRGGWNTGFRSCAAWLSWRVGLDLGAARERVRVARALGTLPALAEALARGELSYAKVRALTRVATPETEPRLLAVGRAGTAADVARIVRGWRRVDRQAEARELARQHAGRALHVYQDEDGTVVLRGRLAPEVGALLLRALDAARETLYQRRRATEAVLPVGEPASAAPPRPLQQADALALLAETALHQVLDPGAPGERYQVVVHVDAAVLADPAQPGQSVLEEGSHVSAETSRRLACDARRVVMRHDAEGRVVEVGARTRTIPPALRRALQHRDRSCRFPGCPVRVGQGHHARHWAQGAGRRRCRTWRYCVGGIIARYTRRATRSSECRTGRSSSDGRTAGCCPRCRRLRPCPPIRSRHSGHSTRSRGSSCMRARDSPGGWGSGWTLAGRSACSIRWRHETSNVVTRRRKFRRNLTGSPRPGTIGADMNRLPRSAKRDGKGTTRRKKPRPAGNGHTDLIRQLWEAAVNLRGSIEPADYKRFVLPIVFLRFLSLRYERRRHELERMVKEPGSEYYTKNAKQAAAILEDPDEYRSVGAFILPKPARWDQIVRHAQADDIKVRLDNALEALEKAYPDKLRGLLPRTYAGSNLARENVTGLINLFSRDIFQEDHGGADLVGRVYEYFIGGFADSEGKRGGEYFTPASIVRTLVAMLAPEQGMVFDPCCGSGGMFVQSDLFTRHSRRLSFVGQESKDFTYRLCRMNLFIHGLDGNIQLGNSYFDDRHATLKADYVLANPPFNEGSKSENGWGADRIPDKDPRLVVGGQRLPLSPRNANTMWILHFLHHLKDGGTAGFVMATGELSNRETARLEVRKTLVEQGYVDCVVQLTGQLFANTQIPCSLWFLSKNRDGQRGYRARQSEILFIDGRKLGSLIPGSRKQKQLSDEEIQRIASVYRTYCEEGRPPNVPGFCKATPLDDVRGYNYALGPGRYVGAEDGPEDDEPLEEKFPRLVKQLEDHFARSAELEVAIRDLLGRTSSGG